MLEEVGEPVALSKTSSEESEYTLTFPLTPYQKRVAMQLCKDICKGDVLLQCVCGAGKTEMVVPLISLFLKEGKKVCFAIARRQVVMEVRERLQGYFPQIDVIAVCGGSTSKLDGGLIVCTTHQLYRYYKAFDLLILDEPDAFPFHNDPVLHGIAKTASVFRVVYLTATPDEELQKRIKENTITVLKLDQRPHGKPLPVPRVKTLPTLFLIVALLMFLHRHKDHPRLLFVPKIKLAKQMHYLFSFFVKCHLITSKSEDRDAIMQAYKEEANGILIATTVMERGVTIKDVDVAVLFADHSVFDEAGLVQIAGRAGRNFFNPVGDVLFLCRKKSVRVKRCVSEIERCNHAMLNVS